MTRWMDGRLRAGSPFVAAKVLGAACAVLLCGAPMVAEGAVPVAAEQEPCTPNGQPAAPVSVHVTDVTGAAVEHAAVSFSCGAQVFRGLTDRSGNVVLTVRGGSYQMLVQAPGFGPMRQAAVLPATQPLQVLLRAGETSEVVNVSGDSGIVPTVTNFGAKTDVALVELPQTVNIVSERELQLRNVQTVNEALKYTPGVQTDEYGFEPRQDWMLVRGFTADQYGMFRDGMRWNSLAGKVDPYELESVEVIKGPASVLYGQAPPGGLVNLSTKRPALERSGSVEGQFGSYDRRQGQFDVTGSLDQNHVFRYRLLGLIRNSGTQVNYVPDDRRLIAPEIGWNPSERTSVTVLSDWQHDTTKWGPSLPTQGTLYSNPNGPISPSTFPGEPGHDGVVRDQASVGYLADHRFADGWELHQSYRYQYSNFEGSTVYQTGFAPGSTTDVTRSYFGYPQRTYIHTLDTRALRHVNAGRWQHTVLAGFDFSDMAQGTIGSLSTVADINIYRPVYGATIPAGVPYLHNFLDTPQYGVYLQDQIRYGRHVAITAGGREDWAVQDVRDFLYGANQHQNSSKFTGRVGVSYLTDIGINPYYSYSTSFQPTTGTDFFGTLFRPTYGEQHEGGVKIQPRTWNSFFTASVFRITQSNTLTTDPNTAHPFASVQGGSVRSQGVELEAVTQLHQGLSLHGGYSLTATSYLSGSSAAAATIGKWFPQVPRQQFSLLTDYAIPEGRLAGLGGTFGVRFTGLSYGDNLNTLLIPNYVLLDASLRYTYRRTDFAVNATNVTNRTYVATCSGAAYCDYGYQRNVIGTARYHF